MMEEHRETNEKDFKSDWQALRQRMNMHRITPKKIAYLTKYPIDRIMKGTSGELIPITTSFLNRCVRVFGLVDSRAQLNAKAQSYEDTDESLSYDECMRLIKPPPAMPPLQGNFWEREDSKD